MSTSSSVPRPSLNPLRNWIRTVFGYRSYSQKKSMLKILTLIVRSKDGDLELNHLALQFQQGTEGSLACENLRLPGVGVWDRLHAGLSYNQGKLALTDLMLDPILEVRQLQIDLSGSDQGQYHLTLDGKALGSPLLAKVSYLQPADKAYIDATLNAIDLELRKFRSCGRCRFPDRSLKSNFNSGANLIVRTVFPVQSPPARTGCGTKTTSLGLPVFR